MTFIKRISLIGTGAMGMFYAGKLFDMDPHCISLIAGGDRHERLKKQGFFVNDQHYLLPVVRPDDPPAPSDLIVVAVKHHHLPQAIQDIQNSIGPDTILLSVMNGIDSEAQLGAAYGMEKVLYAVAVGIDALREDNRLIYTTQGRLFFGEAENEGVSDRVKAIQALLDRAGIAYETPPDMIRVLWWKFMINVGINQASAVLRAPYAVFQSSRQARDLMESAMREVMAIAQKAQVNLTEKDIENWYAVLSGLSPDGKTSMLQDVEAGRKTEVDMLAGRVLELGKAYHIPTPVNEDIFRNIKAMERE
ncbi:MAG: ketopantoate reductase family protein [Deltaproteobacteria bacterium]|nr:ketopantoate reductase family protein [Deltaproteobacteria bacterium]MCF8120184.1 ketopantoate reductase family protein [Deltaproteobacteria bacterium]